MAETKTISILGVTFEVTTPYVEGHQITAAEARALNQTRAENIGNNFRTKVKEAQNAEDPAAALAEVQAAFAEVDASYEFTLSTGGGGSFVSPLEKELKRLAKQTLSLKLKEAGLTFKAYKEKNGEEYVAAKLEEIAGTEQIQKLAKKNVAETEKASAAAVGL